MSKRRYGHIEAKHRAFIEAQHVFFVATAAPTGRVNVAPKGQDTLRILAPDRIVWLNLTGSENETAAHVRESGRMTLMWCSFDRTPLILRAYGNPAVLHPRDEGWDDICAMFPSLPGARQVIDLEVDLVLESCGFGVPLYEFAGQRETLVRWGERQGPEGLRRFWEARNVESIDGEPTGIFYDGE